MNESRPVLDPRIVGFIVLLFGITAMFMNKALTAHIICAVAAVYLLAAKAYKPFGIYITIYISVAFLMANITKVSNSSIILFIVSISYFVQKLIVLMMMGSFFTRMTKIPYVLSAMQHMKIPDAVVVPIMVILRFFPSIQEDYHSLKDSLRLRKISVSPLQFIIHPVRMMEYLFVPILMKSIRISDELAASALLRGFEHTGDQTILYPLKMKIYDYCIGIISVAIVAVLFYLQYNYGGN